MSKPRTLGELLAQAADATGSRMHVSIPARVLKYDAAKQSVDVQPAVKDSVYEEDGSRSAISIPIITAVPVLFPGGGAFRITFPIAVGDFVLLVFSDRSLDLWLKDGGGDVDPVDPRRHALSDAVAIPTIRPFSDPWESAPTNGVSVGADSGMAIHITSTGISLGEASAVDAVAMAAKVQAQLSALKTAISGAAVIGGDGGASFKAALVLALASWPASVGSTTVKVKG